MNSVVDRCGSLSFEGDSTDEKTQSIDCTVSQSADEFARQRRQMHWLFHKFNIAVHRRLFKAKIFKVRDLDLKHGAQMV